MSDELKPCPFGSKGRTEIEGKGQIWRGVKGYSDPQYFELRHHGRLHDSDTFPTVFMEIRARTEEQVRAMWNTRADLPATDHAERQAYIEGTQSGWKAAAMLRACKGRVRVKPLEWVKHPNRDIWRCDTMLGVYKVFGVGDQPSWDFDAIGVQKSEVEASIKAAAAAAQADYERRILSALDTQETDQ